MKKPSGGLVPVGCPIVSELEHYERLIDGGNDPAEDSPVMRSYMARWDGSAFYEALGDLSDKLVLEVGVGTGRVAREVLRRGCRRFTGLDLSPKTVARARSNLADHPNVELVVGDIGDFVRPESFDTAYSVLTWMHIEDKAKALGNVVASLRPGGRVVLSIDHAGQWLDYGNRKVRLYPASPEQYASWLEELDCHVEPLIPLTDKWVDAQGGKPETYGRAIATLIAANKKES